MKYLNKFTILAISVIIIFACNTSIKQQQDLAVSEEQEILQKGEKITAATQQELLKNVSAAMKKGGPSYAIEFCNTRAIALTDSLSNEFNCNIERLSMKNRNPDNFPDSQTEKEQLKKYKKQYQKGENIIATTVAFDDRIEYYKPIVVGMETCLKCHGTPENGLSEETKEQLSQLYPDGKATGYELGDFRGAWKVTFYR